MSTTATILAVIFVFVIIKHAMDAKAKQEKDRLRVIEEALRAGALDDTSKEDLLATLSGRRPAPRATAIRNPNDAGFFMKFVAFIGWMALCTGGGLAITGVNDRSYEELLVPAWILLCVGFGLVTYPFVIRELNSPRRSHAEQRS